MASRSDSSYNQMRLTDELEVERVKERLKLICCSMLPASYARLAGHQSETNKLTITRVANNEVQYRRKINSYRKDMDIKISGIRREQAKLRRSMLRYRKVIKEHRRQRREAIQKDQEDSISCQSDVLSFVCGKDNKMEDIEEQEEDEEQEQEQEESEGDIDDLETTKVQDCCLDEQRESINDSVDGKSDAVLIERDGQKEVKDEGKESGDTEEISEKQQQSGKSKTSKKRMLKKRLSGASFSSLKTLATIAEDDERCRLDATKQDAMARTESHPHGSRLESRKKKKKKQNVSYSDLIRLQHSSSNTRLLFRLVDELAHTNGIHDQQKRQTIPDIRDHVNFRGESPAQASTITKTGAVFYPIRFGYASEACPDKLSDDRIKLSDDRIRLSEDRVTGRRQSLTDVSGQTTHGLQALSRVTPRYGQIASDYRDKLIHHGNSDSPVSATQLSRSKWKRKSVHSLPSLVEEVNKIKSVHKCGQHPNQNDLSLADRCYDEWSATRKSTRSRSLPPIDISQTIRYGTRDMENNNKVAWQSALAKVKSVHTLVNLSWMY